MTELSLSVRDSLRISEIFYSIQGESRSIGFPTVFIRLTGCPLRCQYCDTAYAFTGGKRQSIDAIVKQVKAYQAHYVTVTGGEPLAQKECLTLLTELCDAGYQVSLETSGAICVAKVDPRVIKVLDVKTPDSQEADKNLYDNFQKLTNQDQVKFVVCSQSDFDWSIALIKQYQLLDLCEVLVSPSYGQVALADLADWVLRENLPVRMQTQLHKHIWGDEKGR